MRELRCDRYTQARRGLDGALKQYEQDVGNFESVAHRTLRGAVDDYQRLIVRRATNSSVAGLDLRFCNA